MINSEQHFMDLERLGAEVDKLVQLRNKKVCDELRNLANDIEAMKIDVEAYEYSFRLQSETYTEDETGNEMIRVEFTRMRD